MGFLVGIFFATIFSGSIEKTKELEVNPLEKMCAEFQVGGDRQIIDLAKSFEFEGRVPTYFAAAPQGEYFVWKTEISKKGARYIAIEFSNFDLPSDAKVIVRDYQGDQSYVLTGKGKGDGKNFWSKHIKGSNVIIEYHWAQEFNGRPFDISQFRSAFFDANTISSICGQDDKKSAVCYKDTNPIEYEKGRAVGRLMRNGSGFCTGWLLGPEGLLITNNHCISSNEEAMNTDYEFGAESANCDQNVESATTTFSGGELLATDAELDYALIKINDGNPADDFGYLELDNREATVGEEIYIIGHPGGRLKEFTINSTHERDTGGIPRIDTTQAAACTSGSGTFDDIGYYGDTEPGSSGSPVLARSSNEVIGLHHCGNCLNRAAPIHLVYQQISHFLISSAGRFSASDQINNCSGTIKVNLADLDLEGTGAQMARFTSKSGDIESFELSELSGGKFKAEISLTQGSAAPGDGVFQVSHGDKVVLSFIDEDHGGAGELELRDEVQIDCQAPQIEQHRISNVRHYAAIFVQGSEPSKATVRYGKTCNNLDGFATSDGADVGVQLLLNQLQPETQYYYEIQLDDAAGNSTIDDNNGQCYSLRTMPAPTEFFSQNFRYRDFNLSNQSILYTPDGGSDYYSACRADITSLPSDDTTGSQTLDLADDDSVSIELPRPLRFFGASLSKVYVGSNGYLTSEKDVVYNETIDSHFRKMRISGVFDDLNPRGSGRVSWQDFGDRFAFTWRSVKVYGSQGTNTFQIEIFDDGRIRQSWLDVNSTSAIVGLSDGNGTPGDFEESVFVSYPECM